MTTFQSTNDVRPIDLIIFDCDGVLIDSEALSANVLTDVLKEEGVCADSKYIRRHFLGRSFSTVEEHILRRFNVALPRDFEGRYISQLLGSFERELTSTRGIFSMLDKLNTPYCVATSSSPRRAARSLEVVGLRPYFEGVVFTSTEVENGKPAPDLFLHAASKMGVQAAHCLVIEDSAPGIAAGLAAKMDVIRFIGGTHFTDAPPVPIENVETFDNWSKLLDLRPALIKGSTQ